MFCRGLITLALLGSGLQLFAQQTPPPQPQPQDQPRFEFGDIVGTPGSSNLAIPLSVSFSNGVLNGWSALIRLDLSALSVSGFTHRRETELVFLDEPSEFSEAGTFRVHVVYSVDDRERMLSPSDSGVVGHLELCVLDSSLPGLYPVELLPSATLDSETALVETAYAWLSDDLSHSFVGQPGLRSGSVTVQGEPLRSSECQPYGEAIEEEPPEQEPPPVPDQPQPNTTPVFELGSVSAVPGESNLAMPLSISFTDGLLSGWAALLGHDPSVLTITSFDLEREAELVLFEQSDVFTEPGVVRVHVAYSSDIDPTKLLAPSKGEVVGNVRFCVLEGAAVGKHAVELLPSAFLKDSPGAPLETAYGWYSDDLSHSFVGQPLLSAGKVSVAGEPVEGTCSVFQPPKPEPFPKVVYELHAPQSVEAGQEFSVRFVVDSEIPLLGLAAAITSEDGVLTPASVTTDATLFSSDLSTELFAVSDNSIGLIVGPGDGPIPAGRQEVATLTFTAGRSAQSATIRFSENPVELVMDSEGLNVVVPFPNLVVEYETETTPGTFSPASLLDDALLVTPATGQGAVLAIRAEPLFRRGDPDLNEEVEMADALAVLNFLFLQGTKLACFDAGDADDSGDLNVSDPIAVLNFLFLGGAVLPSPGPYEAGVDPTTDALDCASG